LLSAISNLVDDDGIFRIEVGADDYVLVSGEPLAFHSKISYNGPDETKEALNDYPDEEEEIVTEEPTTADAGVN